jgi:hypothetical protein
LFLFGKLIFVADAQTLRSPQNYKLIVAMNTVKQSMAFNAPNTSLRAERGNPKCRSAEMYAFFNTP